MKHIELYCGAKNIMKWTSEKALVEYDVATSLYKIFTVGQKLVISNPVFLIYDEGTSNSCCHNYTADVVKMNINDNYKNGEQSILLYNDNKEVMRLFHGKQCGVESIEDGITTLFVDDNKIKTIGFNYLVIARN